MKDCDIKMNQDRAYEMVIGVAAGEIVLPQLGKLLKRAIK
jgi:hypothetical protein